MPAHTRTPVRSVTRGITALALAASAASAQPCNTGDIYPTATVLDPAGGEAGLQIFAEDLNNDGDLDILVGRYFSSNADVIVNDGAGSFLAPSTVLLGNQAFLTLADLNGDGYLDIAASQYQSSSVRVRLNNGNGTFAGSFFYPTDGLPQFVVAADFDADGDNDLAIASTLNTVTILDNDGTGRFENRRDLPAGNMPTQLAAADLDADGDIDIVVTNYFTGTVNLIRNAGGGQFSPSVSVGVASAPQPVRIADIDADGLPDIVVGCSNTVSILRNLGGFNFASAVNYPAASSGQDLAVGDVNGDGWPDIAVAGGSSVNNAGLLMSDGAGSFGPMHPVPADIATSVALADVNADGSLDMVVGAWGASTLLFTNACSVPVSIDQHPASIAVNPGDELQLSVGVGIGSTPIIYRWRRNGVELNDGGPISGSHTPTLTIANAQPSDSDTYDVMIANASGPVASDPAFVVVRAPSCPYDLNNDEALNFLDVVGFISGFNDGCP